MTKTLDPSLNFGEDNSKRFRKNMMRIMSEVSLNPANVIPDLQEELAMFMVGELKGMCSPNTFNYEKWTPEEEDDFH